jgi:hypothetical protein
MKRNVNWLTAVIAIAGGLANVNSAKAQTVTIDNFQAFVPNALYGSWPTPLATITQNPTSWEVSSYNYGSLWKYEGDINASGASAVQVTINILNPTADPTFVAGPIVDLVDNTGKWAQFYWYGQTAGNDVLTANFNALPSPDYITAGFNFADIQHIHLELDPGSFTGLYDLQYQNLALVVPEPATMTLVALGALTLLIARRRAR